jgi:hypothetical protein
MHESFEENEWDAVIEELEFSESNLSTEENFQQKLIAEFKIEPVFLTIGLSIEAGVTVQVDGDNDALMVALLSSLFRGDLDKNILDEVPKFKAVFPSWGDEAPMIYPDSTLWENLDEDE